VEQDRLVLKPTATTSSRIQFLVGGGFGLVCLAGAVWNLIHLGDKGTISAFVILLLLGLFLLFGILLLMSVRTVFDATGIHIGAGGRGRDIPWPRSRTGLFVRVRLATGKAILIANNAQAMVVTPEGRAVSLTGLIWMGPLPDTIEAKGVAEIDRIWQWALARGYAHETGWYTELRGAQKLLQIQRRKQEERYGLV